MKKINITLVLACLFIVSVMFYLMKSGVHLKERTLIKWSQVSTGDEAGRVVMKHLYPLLQSQSDIGFVGQGLFYNEFTQSFLLASKKQNIEMNYHFTNQVESKAWVSFVVIDATQKVPDDSCSNPRNQDCLILKAQKSFQKKEREASKIWIKMQRFSRFKMFLFYIAASV